MIASELEVGLTEPSVEEEIRRRDGIFGCLGTKVVKLGESANMLALLEMWRDNVEGVVLRFLSALNSVLP